MIIKRLSEEAGVTIVIQLKVLKCYISTLLGALLPPHTASEIRCVLPAQASPAHVTNYWPSGRNNYHRIRQILLQYQISRE